MAAMTQTRDSGAGFDDKFEIYKLIDLLDGVPVSAERLRGSVAAWKLWPFSYENVIKRALDIVGALLIILCCLPVMVLAAAAVATNGRPIFYMSQRVGRGGVTFRCIKFRTMVPGADHMLTALLQFDERARAEWDHSCKLEHDPRVTRIGRVLRATSLDELPQLFNVLFGQMSLVGPRPVPKQELHDRFGQNMIFYLRVRPGLTGPWQVSGRSNLSYDARVSLDVAYAEAPSLLTDLRILVRTASAVLMRKGAR